MRVMGKFEDTGYDQNTLFTCIKLSKNKIYSIKKQTNKQTAIPLSLRELLCCKECTMITHGNLNTGQ